MPEKPKPSKRILTKINPPRMLQSGRSIDIYASEADLDLIWASDLSEFGQASFWGKRDEEDKLKFLFSPVHIEVMVDDRWNINELARYFECFFDEEKNE